MDSLYLSGYIQSSKEAIVECLGYRNNGYEVINETSSEDVKLAGLILNAKSILLKTTKIRAVFGNETDSCILLYNKIKTEVSHGRSALTSVENFSSAIKGRSYTPQHKPYTSLRSIESGGTIMFKDQLASFYYNHNYDPEKRVMYDGWFVLRGDTLTASQVRDKGNYNSKLLNNALGYPYWLQLSKNKIIYAAVFMSDRSNMKFYISKNLSETDRILIAAYFSVIVYWT